MATLQTSEHCKQRMMIWEATKKDVPDLMNMTEKFFDRSGAPGQMEIATVLEFIDRLLESPDATVFRSDSGMLAVVDTAPFYSNSWRIAMELAWWSEDGSGPHLLRRMFKWAKERGVHEVRLSTISEVNGDRVSAFIQKLGFTLAEQGFRKVL